jgi:hypothetical protein
MVNHAERSVRAAKDSNLAQFDVEGTHSQPHIVFRANAVAVVMEPADNLRIVRSTPTCEAHLDSHPTCS